jgi:hypothetical protein
VWKAKAARLSREPTRLNGRGFRGKGRIMRLSALLSALCFRAAIAGAVFGGIPAPAGAFHEALFDGHAEITGGWK